MSRNLTRASSAAAAGTIIAQRQPCTTRCDISGRKISCPVEFAAEPDPSIGPVPVSRSDLEPEVRCRLLEGHSETLVVSGDIAVDQPLEGFKLSEAGRVLQIVDDVFREPLTLRRGAGGLLGRGVPVFCKPSSDGIANRTFHDE